MNTNLQPLALRYRPELDELRAVAVVAVHPLLSRDLALALLLSRGRYLLRHLGLSDY